MKDLRDWYKYLEVITREPVRDSQVSTPPQPAVPNEIGLRRKPIAAVSPPATPAGSVRRGREARRVRATRPVLTQEALPIDLGTATPLRKKGGRRPLTETREEIIHRLMDPVLTLHEAAAILSLSKATVRRYTEQGRLICQRTAGGQRRFRLSDVMALLETVSTPPSLSSQSQPLAGTLSSRKAGGR